MSSELAVEMHGGRWKRYPAYWDSGVEWLGDVPESWEINKLGYQAKMIVPMRDKPPRFNGDIPWIRIEDFDGKYISNSKSNQRVSKEIANLMNLKVYPIGTVLCSCSCNMGATAIVDNQLISNQTFIGIVPKENIDSEYLYYLMNSNSERLQYLGSGAIQQYLSKENFQNLKFALPPLSEQRSIAAFLDREIGRIDTLIEKKERQIDLLQEKRIALINQAVTKGLNPDIKMKDSMVEWIGEVPECWNLNRVRYLFHEVDSRTNTGNEVLFSLSKSKGLLPRSELTDKVARADTLVGYKIFASGDIVMNKMQAWNGMFGITNDEGIVSPDYAVYRQNHVSLHVRYFVYLFTTRLYVEQFRWRSRGMGTAFLRLNTSEFNDVVAHTPPLSEQRAIVTFLDRETKLIDSLTTKVRESISKLRKYRTALISDAVTGKIDVRQEVS